MKITELKPCPFCGAEPMTRVRFKNAAVGPNPAEISMIVRCPECGCDRTAILKLSDTTFEKALGAMEYVRETWNRRV